jgi:hypothetical protein
MKSALCPCTAVPVVPQSYQTDFPSGDLLLVMGTSLVVNPFASLIGKGWDEPGWVGDTREQGSSQGLSSGHLLGWMGARRCRVMA